MVSIQMFTMKSLSTFLFKNFHNIFKSTYQNEKIKLNLYNLPPKEFFSSAALSLSSDHEQAAESFLAP